MSQQTQKPADSLHPYRGRFPSWPALPAEGLSRDEILRWMEAFRAEEEGNWKEGHASGAVYHGDQTHIDFLSDVYKIQSQSNPLHVDMWPSAVKFEAEIVAMTAHMLGAAESGAAPDTEEEICGTVSSGGTESILLAMKTYRDWARAERGITAPELVIPATAHAAFYKASQYFNIELVAVPVKEDTRADVDAMRAAITDNTICVVGSAPPFPHGTVDPIEELSELARERGVGFHTDACLGGFLLPWAVKLGYPVPAFDFRLPGVTSMSCDTHKFGYAAKGTSVVLYRGHALRHHQYSTVTDWPGGLYCSPTFAGSRPGALSAECWAAMLAMGEAGYLDATRRILETAAEIRRGLEAMPGVRVLGDPLWVLAFASDEVDIYKVMDAMSERGWSLNGLQMPASIHLCVTLRHAQPGVPERFLADLRDATQFVRDHPEVEGGMAPIYGMAASVPDRSMVANLMKNYMDQWYEL